MKKQETKSKTTKTVAKPAVSEKKTNEKINKSNSQEKKLNELVERLTKQHDVECVRPEKTAEALKECIDRDYVHVMFKETGTELGVQLYRAECKMDADYENAKGNIHIVGGLTLNYDKVKCVADIDLSTCEGKGYLLPVNDDEYKEIIGN